MADCTDKVWTVRETDEDDDHWRWCVQPVEDDPMSWMYVPDEKVAHRIIACVNACKGISTDDLTAGRIHIAHSISQNYTEPLYMMSGTKQEMVEHAKKLLEQE